MGRAAASHAYVRQPGGAARITLAGSVTVDVAVHDAGMGLT